MSGKFQQMLLLQGFGNALQILTSISPVVELNPGKIKLDSTQKKRRNSMEIAYSTA